MAINNCSSLVTIPRDSLLGRLSSLDINECMNLQLLSSMQESHCYPALQRLHLKCCDCLISFPLSPFTKLEDLLIEDCSNLELISCTVNSLPCLQKIKLKNCDKLASLPLDKLVTSLSHLTISACPLLKVLCDGKYHSLVSRIPNKVIQD